MTKYTLTVIRDDGESHVTTFEGYFAEQAADATFRECSGQGNRRHVIFAVLIGHYPKEKGQSGSYTDIRSQWPKFAPPVIPPMPKD